MHPCLLCIHHIAACNSSVSGVRPSTSSIPQGHTGLPCGTRSRCTSSGRM
jgi:hypothetical protein